MSPNQQHVTVSSQAEVRTDCASSTSLLINRHHEIGQARSLNKELIVHNHDDKTIPSRSQDLNIDLSMVSRFLTTLAQVTESDEFTFQVFPEGQSHKGKAYAKILHGTLAGLGATLMASNREGCGVYVTVNQTDGKGRKEGNILQVRALFVDLDGSPLEPIQQALIEPHIIVESSPGRFHAYWIVEGVSLKEFSSIQKALAKKFAGDPAVNDLSRVMRLPGFYHLKNTPQQTKIIFESSQQPCSREQFFSAFEICLSNQGEATFPHNKNSPVLEALKRYNMLIRKEAHPPGCWIIKCPWEHLHSSKDNGTKYFEKDNGPGGFNCFHNHCKDKNINHLLAYLGIEKHKPTEPLPLHRSIPPPNPYPVEALGEILAPAVKALQSIIKAPDAVCAQSILDAVALACQAFVNIEIDGRVMPLSLFLITVAESGERKSATDQVALSPVYEWQRMLAVVYRSELSHYQQQYEVWEALKKDFLRGLKNGGSSAYFDLSEPIPPLDPLLLLDEPTYEGLVKHLAIGQPSMGIFSDEGGRFFGGHAMNRDNQIKTISGLSSLWDGKPINRSRAGESSMLLYGRRVSLHLMIQESILTQLMGNKDIEHQGFLPRCLLSFPASTAGNRSYSHQDASKNKEILSYYSAINSLLDKKFPVDPPPAPQNELKPRGLILTEQAKTAWVKFHDAIDKDIASGRCYQPIRRFGSKAAEHVLRIAGNLAMISDPEVKAIQKEYIHRAIELVEYYLSEILRVQGYLSVPHSLMLAQKVLNWCWDKGKEILKIKDLYQNGPVELREAKKARESMAVLEEHGWVIQISGKKDIWVIRKTEEEAC